MEEPPNDDVGTLSNKINQLQKQIQAERIQSIKEKLQRNQKKLQCHTSGIMSAVSTRDSSQTEENTTRSILSSRMDRPLCKFYGFTQGPGDRNQGNQDMSSATSIKIPRMERLPPYTSWIFLDRNQRMADDQSVVGRRRIYYDQRGSEALICSDSEEELTEPDGEKHEFCDAEDRILCMAFEEHGLNEEVLNVVSKYVGGTSLEIQERYKSIRESNIGRLDQHPKSSGEHDFPMSMYLEKNLSDALDSLDNLFCRRCLIFDCRLHGCSQPLIYPSEKKTVWSEPVGDRKPCGDQCYLQLKVVKSFSKDSTPGSFRDKKTTIVEETDGILSPSSAEEPGSQSTTLPTRIDCHGYINLNDPDSENLSKRKVTNQSDTAQCDSRSLPDSQDSCKKLKRISDVVTVITDNSKSLHLDGPKAVTNETELKNSLNSMEERVDGILGFSDWKPLEKELYLKGVEMFGRNSCLIARNLLSGSKTCMEISSYMHDGGMSIPHRSIISAGSIMDDKGKFDTECTDQDMPSRPRLLRKRGKTRKFKYSWKSAKDRFFFFFFTMSEEYYNSKKTDDICDDVCGQGTPAALSMSRLRCILRGLDFKTYIFMFVIIPIGVLFIYLHGQKISYFLRPLWESPPKPFHEIPHYYHENVSMESLCKLHGWGIRESPRRVFDAVLFSNEVDMLTIRWKEMYPYVSQYILLESNSTFTGFVKPLIFASNRDKFKFVEPRLTYGTIGGRFRRKENPFIEEARQRVVLDQLLRIAGIEDDDLLIMSDVDEIPSAHTINLLRWCDDIPPILHLQLRNYLYSFEFFLDNKSWRGSIHRYQTDKTRYAHYRQSDLLLSDAGWHCSFCFRHISEFVFKMKAYSHYDRVRFPHYLNPDRIQNVICKGADLFDMLPEEYTFKEIIGKLGPIPHSYSAVHLPAFLLNNADRYKYLLPGNCRRESG